MNFTKLQKIYFQIIFDKICRSTFVLAKTSSAFGSHTNCNSNSPPQYIQPTLKEKMDLKSHQNKEIYVLVLVLVMY